MRASGQRCSRLLQGFPELEHFTELLSESLLQARICKPKFIQCGLKCLYKRHNRLACGRIRRDRIEATRCWQIAEQKPRRFASIENGLTHRQCVKR